jgi:hypothetical protein
MTQGKESRKCGRPPKTMLHNVYSRAMLYTLCNSQPNQIACWRSLASPSLLRPRDVENIGVPREYLLRLHRAGQLERIGRGLYRLPNSLVTEGHNFAQIASRVPQAVICLLSALVFHDIGTQNPFEVWIALPRDRDTQDSTFLLSE